MFAIKVGQTKTTKRKIKWDDEPTFKDNVEALFPLLWRASEELPKGILEDLLSAYVHRQVLPPQALLYALKLLIKINHKNLTVFSFFFGDPLIGVACKPLYPLGSHTAHWGTAAVWSVECAATFILP